MQAFGETTAPERQSTNGFSRGGVEKRGPGPEQVSGASGSPGKKRGTRSGERGEGWRGQNTEDSRPRHGSK